MVARTGATTYVHPNEADRLRGQAGAIVPVAIAWTWPSADRGVRALETFGHTVGGHLLPGRRLRGHRRCAVRARLRAHRFPGGSTAALWASLQRLLALPEETRVYPGHNYGPTPTSTLSSESLENPYLRCRTFEEFRQLRDRPAEAEGVPSAVQNKIGGRSVLQDTVKCGGIHDPAYSCCSGSRSGPGAAGAGHSGLRPAIPHQRSRLRRPRTQPGGARGLRRVRDGGHHQRLRSGPSPDHPEPQRQQHLGDADSHHALGADLHGQQHRRGRPDGLTSTTASTRPILPEQVRHRPMLPTTSASARGPRCCPRSACCTGGRRRARRGGRPQSRSGYDISLLLRVPVLFHAFQHVFVGATPFTELDLVSKSEGRTSPRRGRSA
jgi:hypothetical protein